MGGSFWENWNTNITLCSLPTQYLEIFSLAPLPCYSFFFFLKWNKKVKKIKKLKALSHSEVQNVESSTYVEGFAVNTTTQVICNSQHINETNITTTFIINHEKFWKWLFFITYTKFVNLVANTICVEFLKFYLNYIMLKNHTHAHTCTITWFSNDNYCWT